MTTLVGFLAKRFETRTARCNSVILGAADYCASQNETEECAIRANRKIDYKESPP
jgi:hypothetical protein